MSSVVLEISGVTKQFGGLRAVDNVTLSVQEGKITSIIGPNGAGKTTFFNLLSGQLTPTAGNIYFYGELFNHVPPHARARRGMGRTFQIAKPLIGLTALENVLVGTFMHRRALGAARDQAMAVLSRLRMDHLAHRRASELTLSERRRLEVARALALEPRIVLLDEVMAGLNQSEIGREIELLQQLNAEGMTFLIIEHNLKVVRTFSDTVVVLDRGKLIAQGTAEVILNSRQVVEAYLGSGYAGESEGTSDLREGSN